MRATVLVRPKAGILDPQGEAVESSLRQLGFAVGEARVGRVIDLEVDAATSAEAARAGRADVRAAAREPADRELRDRARDRRRRVSGAAARGSRVLVFPGSNDDRDAAWALAALGAEPVLVWHARRSCRAVDGVVLPGGFSYGDYLRCGAIARFSPAMQRWPVRRGRRARARDLQRLPDPLRGRASPGVLRAERVALFRLPGRRAARRARRTRRSPRAAARAAARHPGQAREGCWFAAAGRSRGARARGRSSSATRPARTRTARSADIAGV